MYWSEVTLPSKGTTMATKCPLQHNRATGFPHCVGQAFRPVLFSWRTTHVTHLAISHFTTLYSSAYTFCTTGLKCKYAFISGGVRTVRIFEGVMHYKPAMILLCNCQRAVDADTICSHPAFTFSVTWGRIAFLFFLTYRTNVWASLHQMCTIKNISQLNIFVIVASAIPAPSRASHFDPFLLQFRAKIRMNWSQSMTGC